MESKERLHILLVEDDEDDYVIARRMLSMTTGIKCDLDWASSYDDGISRLVDMSYDVCLADFRLGSRTGLDLLNDASERGVRTPVILLTGQGDYDVDLKAMMAGAADYLVKSEIDASGLERSIRYALERRMAEDRIRDQAQYLDNARDAICAYDLGRNVIYWNKSAERLTGYSLDEVQGDDACGCLFSSDGQKVEEAWEAVLSTGEWTGELRQRTKEGDELVFESRWTLVGEDTGTSSSVLVINTDITERKRLESNFLRAQRMESIGTLVGGIAHDLGNLLVPILLGVNVLSKRHGDNEKTMRTLEMIRRSAERGSDMVKQVLAFARGVEGERVSLKIDEVFEEVEKITTETFPASLDVRIDIDEDLPPIVGDATQIQQVIINLCVNARDAMPEGGRLWVEARTVHLSASDARANPDAEEGEYICVSVRDTGVGISPEDLDKVFEPYFTTKSADDGTGLGLSTVYSIVKSHDGFVDVHSRLGRGTTFRCFLPPAGEFEDEGVVEDSVPVDVGSSDGEAVGQELEE